MKHGEEKIIITGCPEKKTGSDRPLKNGVNGMIHPF